MAKSNYKVDSKVVAKTIKEAEKVRKIQSQIEKLKAQLVEIEDNNNWLNYTSWGEGLTQDEAIAFGEAQQIINYASRH